MKKSYLHSKILFLTALLAVTGAFFPTFAQQNEPWSQNTSPLPAPTGFVNDYAGVVDQATKDRLETRLKELRDKTTVEIAVAVVRTTGDRQIFDYSLAVARGWGIGSKADDNPSALLFIAIDDRKYFTQVSRDLEDELPDGLVGSLQRQYLVPEFKKGNYAKGISDTIEAYIAAIEGRSSGTATPAPRQTPGGGTTSAGGIPLFGIFCCGIIIIVVLVLIFSNRKGGPSKNDRDRWGGGGFGGGGSSGGDILPAVLGGIIGSALSGGSSSGSSSDWGSSGGSDWGGFGGGGDFGGGGAGGDW